MIKLWDMSEFNKPKLLVSKPMKVGPLFCMSFDVSNPYIIAAGGGQDVLAIWDITENATADKWVTAGEYARAVAEAKASGKPIPPPPADRPAAAPAPAAAAKPKPPKKNSSFGGAKPKKPASKK